MIRTTIRTAVIATLVVGGAACSSHNKVGDQSLLNFKGQAQQRLGVTTTTKPVPTTTASAAAGPQKQAIESKAPSTTVTTAPKAQATTTAPPANVATTTVSINSDTAASSFDPSALQVVKGTIVKWINKDSVPRSVEADDGTFVSGSIPPGGTFTYTASTPGKFNYHDGTRPYAVASLEVLAR